MKKNQVIKVLDIKHGEKVVKYWESCGFDNTMNGNSVGNYYGPTGSDNDVHLVYQSEIDRRPEIEIIELPSEKPKAEKRQIIKVLDNAHGLKVVDYFVKQGLDNYSRLVGNSVGHYYGDIDGLGKINSRSPTDLLLADFEVIELPPARDGFIKGEYIVLLSGCGSSSLKNNHVYKVRENYKYLKAEVGFGVTSGSVYHPYDKSRKNDWRYATNEEIEAYDKAGKPVNINAMTARLVDKPAVTQFMYGDYIVLFITSSSNCFKPNVVYKQRENCDFLRVYKDMDNDQNGLKTCLFKNDYDWRYATQKEVDAYERAGKPVYITDVPTVDIEPLEVGEYYYVTIDGGSWMLGKVAVGYTGDSSTGGSQGRCFYGLFSFKGSNPKLEQSPSWCYSGKDRTYRKATTEERDWLDYCHAENRFVPMEEYRKEISGIVSPISNYYYRIEWSGAQYMIIKAASTAIPDKSARQQNISYKYGIYYDGSGFRFKYNDSCCWKDEGRTCVLASKEDIDWLEACDKAGKFVRKGVVVETAEPVVSGTEIRTRDMIPGKFYYRGHTADKLEVIEASDRPGRAKKIVSYTNAIKEDWHLTSDIVMIAGQDKIDWFHYCVAEGKWINPIEWQKKLKDGEERFLAGIYYTIRYNSGMEYVTKCAKDGYLGHWSSPESKSYGGGGAKYPSDRALQWYRLATYEEVSWLEACKSAGRWRPFPTLPVEANFAKNSDGYYVSGTDPYNDGHAIRKEVLTLEECQAKYPTFDPAPIDKRIAELKSSLLILKEESPIDLGVKSKKKINRNFNF